MGSGALKVDRPWRAVFLGGELSGRRAEVNGPFPEQRADLAEALGDPRRAGTEAVYRLAGEPCHSCRTVIYRHAETRRKLVVAQAMDIPAFRLPAGAAR